MVIYRGVDGKPGYHQTDDIHDAVGFVERMRNEEGVEHARIFRLEEVVFEYRPYYRVELTDSSGRPAIEGNQAAVLPGADGTAQVGPGADSGDTVDVEVVDSAQSTDGAESGTADSAGSNGSETNGQSTNGQSNGEVGADAGSKKGLFGR
jgi:hypothetical protein